MAAILLDWDGALVDSAPLYLDLYREACRRVGKVLPIGTLEEFREWYRPDWEQNYYDLGFTREELEDTLAFSEEFLRYDRAELFPGVPELLRRLSVEWPLAVVSTTPSSLIRPRLRAEGLEELFQVFTGGEDGSSEKVEKVARTLEALGTGRGAMVGDTALDVAAGRRHGLATVGVTYGWSAPHTVRAAAPDVLAEEPSRLEQAIRSAMALC